MINLQDFFSFPSLFDKKDNSLIFPSNVDYSSSNTITLDDIKPILLNRTLRYPREIYTEYRNVSFNSDSEKYCKCNLNFDVIVIPTGLLGIEYNKTHIYRGGENEGKLCALVEVVYGSALIMLQRTKAKERFQIGTEVDEVVIIRVSQGAKVPIYSGYMYEFINSKSKPLIIAKTYISRKIDYTQIKREQGLAYYIIRKNARQEVVKNPRYKEVPNARMKIRFDNEEVPIDIRKPLYNQLIEETNKFQDLFN